MIQQFRRCSRADTHVATIMDGYRVTLAWIVNSVTRLVRMTCNITSEECTHRENFDPHHDNTGSLRIHIPNVYCLLVRYRGPSTSSTHGFGRVASLFRTASHWQLISQCEAARTAPNLHSLLSYHTERAIRPAPKLPQRIEPCLAFTFWR